MTTYLNRWLATRLAEALDRMPAVALLGPRQCGKSTLARRLVSAEQDAVYLDLERPLDRAKLEDIEGFLDRHADRLVCLDEIQRVPSLFEPLRYAIDRTGRPGQFLVLGSASRDLIRQSSETLAGRIRYLELTPFLLSEVSAENMEDVWMRGGYPRSYLAVSDEESSEWRLDFITSFLERDVPFLRPRMSPESVRALWSMVAHCHGQLLNRARLATALGVDNHTVKGYLDLLEGAFMLRRLPPFAANLKKRLVKTPKVYVRDSGALHALLGVETADDLFGHPVRGVSWEGFCIDNIMARMHRSVRASFYRTAKGAEIDLVLERGSRRLALEFKASAAPKLQRGFWTALEDLDATSAAIIAPVSEEYEIRGVRVVSLGDFLASDQAAEFLYS
ncbi:MAG: ATP-binding protein [Lentisphaerae bacterium]|jgi:uncharacterized protein|nr:ATP-binding protein [Lentisphaerota bacterium]MBT4820573.1 ATP-binding protein [Lentisphaerota bacterium]MBT5607707.1 ATP-binding protein [Lentisphaerota bacterium]MBT7062320.1 ATP-binding protein [Lentisphaerota bacterium]MBT7842286.1 ATP-binding protein [Lentisphaerota bacterium]